MKRHISMEREKKNHTHTQNDNIVRLLVPMVVSMKMTTFWDIVPFGLVEVLLRLQVTLSQKAVFFKMTLFSS
jgi:hypothetical protein